MDEKWEIVPDGCHTHSATFVLRDPPSRQSSGLFTLGGVRYHAWIKWDGCTELQHTFNEPFGVEGHNEDDEQGIHICDIDYLCEILQSLKRAALRYFDAQELGESGIEDVLKAIQRTYT